MRAAGFFGVVVREIGWFWPSPSADRRAPQASHTVARQIPRDALRAASPTSVWLYAGWPVLSVWPTTCAISLRMLDERLRDLCSGPARTTA